MRSAKHLDFIRGLPCLICHDNISTEAAHVRMTDSRVGKVNPGHAKPHDYFTVPLCGRHHREQHSMGERDFWHRQGIDPVLLALMLYAVTGNQAEAERIIGGV